MCFHNNPIALLYLTKHASNTLTCTKTQLGFEIESMTILSLNVSQRLNLHNVYFG